MLSCMILVVAVSVILDEIKFKSVNFEKSRLLSTMCPYPISGRLKQNKT